MHRRLVQSDWGVGGGEGLAPSGPAPPTPSPLAHTPAHSPAASASPMYLPHRGLSFNPPRIQVPRAESWVSLTPRGPSGLGLEGPAQPVPAGFLPSQPALPLAGHLPAPLPPLQPRGSPSPDLSTACVPGLHSPESWRLLPALLSLRALPTAASPSEVTEGTSSQNPGVAVLPGARPPGPHHLGGLHPCLCPQHPLREQGWPLS